MHDEFDGNGGGVFVVGADGANLTRRTDTSVSALRPLFSPTGR